jgi:Trp operon repressor
VAQIMEAFVEPLTTAISQFGFPIVAVLLIGFYQARESKLNREENKEREQHYREHQREMAHELGKITTTIDRINNRLDTIESELKVK